MFLFIFMTVNVDLSLKTNYPYIYSPTLYKVSEIQA